MCVCVCMYAYVLSCFWLFATPWTIAPLSMRFSRQEYWYRVPFPTSGDLLNPGIKPTSLVPLPQGGFFTCAIWEVKNGAILGSLQFIHYWLSSLYLQVNLLLWTPYLIYITSGRSVHISNLTQSLLFLFAHLGNVLHPPDWKKGKKEGRRKGRKEERREKGTRAVRLGKQPANRSIMCW